MKKYLAILLSCVMLCAQGISVWAGEDVEGEQYELIEIADEDWTQDIEEPGVMPSLLYIANVITSIVKVSSTQVSIRAETVGSETVKSITVIYVLQKWNGSKWADVGSKTATTYDAASSRKSYTVSGLSSGQYRCKASARVTGYSGYSETLTGYSASIVL